MPTNVDWPLNNVEQVSRKLNVSKTTVRRELRAGRLNGIKVRNAVRIPNESLDKYIRERDYRKVTGKDTGSRGVLRNGLARFYRNLG